MPKRPISPRSQTTPDPDSLRLEAARAAWRLGLRARVEAVEAIAEAQRDSPTPDPGE